MSAVPSSPGFTVVRGRGYRPQQVDAYAQGLYADRDDAWERAARLTVLAKEMEDEAARLREVVARLAPQTYETLGAGAQRLLATVQEEADEVLDTGRADALRAAEEAEAYGRAQREEAAAHAESVRGAAEEHARRVLDAAQREVDEVRVGVRKETKELRSEALAVLRDTRQRCERLLADQAKGQAEQRETEQREEAERVAATEGCESELGETGEARRAEAERALAEAEESARHGQEDADARAAEVLAEARLRVERLERETERVLREHAEAAAEMRAHMDHVRSSLAALVGSAAVPGVPGQASG
ncbi:cellulose-binding protein [Streptomyces cavernicola]|uniref:Cellulose-binding protein n=1 Tax=Streptomyces cavernicola TaxID=3043613 RepID=A0ABT6S5Z1_9ACTN|nr:cellulose-binding protein [Streptomyces sp. B-S-A6]MDI3403518.1 cellulose-binding protein [Streptomyces sp. B-S-A6]